jgi:acetyl esterase/lipase
MRDESDVIPIPPKQVYDYKSRSEPKSGWRILNMRCTILLGCAAIILNMSLIPAFADDEPSAGNHQVMNIWPGMPPGDKPATQPEDWNGQTQMLSNVATPTITVYRPDPAKDTGAAVLVCPGGGFTALAMEHEGSMVADWLNSIGVTGVLLKYRVPNRDGMPRYMAGLQDTQRAMCLIRANASAWNIDPHRVGIIGFSAGGRLVADITTNFDTASYPAVDDADKLSSRPDFAMAIYPGGVVQKDDKNQNLPLLVPDVHPTKQTPPTFIVIATDDRNGSENAVYYYIALKNAGVNAELHIYSEGGHGFGMRPSKAPHATWTDRAFDWLNYHGYLSPAKPE